MDLSILKDASPKEIEKLLTYYLKKVSGGRLNYVIFKPSDKKTLIFIPWYNKEITKPMNPALVFKHLIINNANHAEIIHTVLSLVAGLSLIESTDSTTLMYGIRIAQLFSYLKDIKFDISKLDASISKVAEEIDEDAEDTDDDNKEDEISSTESPAFIIRDFYVITLLNVSLHYSNKYLINQDKFYKYFPINIDDKFIDKYESDNGLLTIPSKYVEDALSKHSSMFPFGKNKKISIPILTLNKEIPSIKNLKDTIWKDEPVSNQLLIASYVNNDTENKTASVIWRMFTITRSDNFVITTFRPFNKMIY